MDSYNYPDSGDSSPRSRDVDPSDSPAFFDDPASATYKLKFMVSYGGKIHPRPHDNHLTYVGGETKLLTVDRHLSLPSLLSRLSSFSSDVSFPISSFKYQLPGEDLDSLISVSSEDDLLHLFLEYDRLLRSSSKPPRMRLFLFPLSSSSSSSTSSTQQPPAQSFMDALNSAPAAPQDALKADPRGGGGGGGPNSVDFLLGFEKGAAFRQDTIRSEQALAVDRGLDPGEVQRQLELQRMQLRSDGGKDSVVYGRRVEEALNASGGGGSYGVPTDYYAPKMVEKSAPQAQPPQQAMPAPATAIPGYWQEKQMPSVGFPATGIPEQQPMYVIPGHPAGGIYHPSPPPPQTQMVRPVGSGSGHSYYAIPQRFPQEVYREHQLPSQPQQQQQQQQQHQMYGMLPQQALSSGQTQFPKVTTGEAMGHVRTSGTGGGVFDGMNYAQVMYAAATASGAYQGMVGGGIGSGNSSGSLNQEGGKVMMSKVTQN